MNLSHWPNYWRPAFAVTVGLTVAIVAWLVARGPHDEFATLGGHRDGVFSLALAPDGKMVASGDGEGTVRIWKLSDRREQAVLKGHSGRLHGIAWSPDGSKLVTGGTDKSIRVWDVATGKEIQSWEKLPKPIQAVAFSPDGSIVAAGLDNDVFYWKVNNKRELRILRGHQRTINGLAFRPGGLELVTFASDGSVRIWDLAKRRQIAMMPGPLGHCFSLSLSADGSTAACVGGGRVHLFDLVNRKSLDPIEPNARIICGAAFSPDGRLLAIGSQDKEIVVWDLQQKTQRKRLNGHNYAVGQMAFLPDSETLVTASHDSSLKLWKVK